jgi:hypothetical protein
VAEVVKNCVAGFHGSVFAYGQVSYCVDGNCRCGLMDR